MVEQGVDRSLVGGVSASTAAAWREREGATRSTIAAAGPDHSACVLYNDDEWTRCKAVDVAVVAVAVAVVVVPTPIAGESWSPRAVLEVTAVSQPTFGHEARRSITATYTTHSNTRKYDVGARTDIGGARETHQRWRPRPRSGRAHDALGSSGSAPCSTAT